MTVYKNLLKKWKKAVWLAKLRDKYDLHMKIERFISNEVPEKDQKYLRK